MIPQRIEIINRDPLQFQVPSYSRRGLYFKVTKDPESDAWDCECERFCFTGIVCRHIKRCMPLAQKLAEAERVLA